MFDIKYRPLKFTDVLGQEGAVAVLKARLQQGTAFDTSYIFSGAFGSGKTTLARILARAMLCQNLNKEDPEPCNECESCKAFLAENCPAYMELDAASNGTIDHVRAIVDGLAFVVQGGSKRIYLLDEIHRMSSASQDVLLKPIEEKKMVGIFCTTEPEKIRGTIRSRCEEYQIRRITREAILARMRMVLEQENSTGFEDDAILTVIDYCDGHVRDILNKLEMIVQMGPVTLDTVRAHLNLGLVTSYYDILLALDDPVSAVGLAEKACERVGPDDVAAGLADAAMNAYRLAHNMFSNFVTVDRELARQLYAKFGDGVIRLAEHFAKLRYSTKISLACDIVSALVRTPVPTAPVVQQVVVALPQQSVGGPPVASAPLGTPSVTTPAPLPVQAPCKYTKGAFGSDPNVLTSVDCNVMSGQKPRGTSVRKEVKLERTIDEMVNAVFTPDAWRMDFERRWLRKK